MVDATTNYKFIIPSDNDLTDQVVFNENFKKLDTVLADTQEEISTLKASQTEQGEKIEVDRAALVEVIDSGRKNLLSAELDAKTKASVTATVHEDGSVSFTGTSTNVSTFSFYFAKFPKFADSELVICSESNEEWEKSRAYFECAVIKPDLKTTWINDKNGAATIPKGATITKVYLSILPGANMDGAVIKPMICPKSLYDISPRFVPYIPSLVELAARVAAIEAASPAAALLPVDERLDSEGVEK